MGSLLLVMMFGTIALRSQSVGTWPQRQDFKPRISGVFQ